MAPPFTNNGQVLQKNISELKEQTLALVQQITVF
jgi:hypothetical protein